MSERNETRDAAPARRVILLDRLGPMVAAGTTPMEVYRDLRFNLDYDRGTALRQAWRFRCGR
jgi:hypothetical protein